MMSWKKGEIEQGREYIEADFNRVIEIKEREAYRELGDIKSIRETCIGFQEHLYNERVV